MNSERVDPLTLAAVDQKDLFFFFFQSSYEHNRSWDHLQLVHLKNWVWLFYREVHLKTLQRPQSAEVVSFRARCAFFTNHPAEHCEPPQRKTQTPTWHLIFFKCCMSSAAQSVEGLSCECSQAVRWQEIPLIASHHFLLTDGLII